MPFSKRVLKEYWVLFRTPLAVETVPLPSFNPPDQWALAFALHSVLLIKAKIAEIKLHERANSCPQTAVESCRRGTFEAYIATGRLFMHLDISKSLSN